MAELASAWVSIFPKFDKSFGSSVGNSVKSSVTSAMSAASVAAGNILASGISKAVSTVSASLGSAIKRTDTMGNYPKMMANLGYSSEEAAAAIETMSKATDGLPTKLDDLVSASTKLAPLRGTLGDAADETIALNNALLAGGKDAQTQANALEQYSQMLAVGKVDMAAWRSMVSAMPGQLDQLSEALLGAGHKNMDLYEAMKSGEVTFDQFGEALKKLNREGVGEFASFEEQARTATQGIGTAIENTRSRISKAVSKVLDHVGQEKIAGVINGISSQFGGIADKVIEALDWIAPHIEPLKAAFESLAQVDMSGLTGPLLSVAQDLIPRITETLGAFTTEIGEALGPLASSLGEIAQGVGETLGGAFDRLRENAEPIVQAVSSVIDIVAQIMAMKWETIINVVSRVAPLIADVVNALAPLAEDILGLISETLDGIFATYDEHADGIREGLGEILSGLTDILHAVLEPIGEIIRDVILPLFGELMGAASDLDLGGVIGDSLHLVADKIREVVGIAKELLGAALEWIQGTLVPWIQEHVGPMLEPLMGILERLKVMIFDDIIPFLTDTIVPALQPVIEAIMNVADLIGTILCDRLQFLFDLINDIFMPAIQWVLEQIIIPFCEKWLPVLWKILSDIVNVIVDICRWIEENVIPIGEEIYKIFMQDVVGAIQTFIAIMYSVWDAVGEVIKGVIDWFADIPKNIETAFKVLGDIIVAPFKTAFNAVADFWNSTIGQLQWDVPDWVPGIGGQTIGAPKLPKLADGGIATSETQAIVGEGASPEAIIPLDRRGLAFLADAGFTRVGNGGDDGDGGRGELAFFVNGQKLATATNADYNAINGSYSIYSSRGLAVSR